MCIEFAHANSVLAGESEASSYVDEAGSSVVLAEQGKDTQVLVLIFSFICFVLPLSQNYFITKNRRLEIFTESIRID